MSKNTLSEEALKNLEKLAKIFNGEGGVKEKINPAEVKYSEKENQIILPAGMSKKQAREELGRQIEEDEQECTVARSFPEWNYKDVLVQIKYASIDSFGWVPAKADSFSKPYYIKIVTDLKNGQEITEEAFYGKLRIAAWEDATCHISINPENGVVSVGLNCKNIYKNKAGNFLDSIQLRLREYSIYRNRAIGIERYGQFGIEFDLIEIKPNHKIKLNKNLQESLEDEFFWELKDNKKHIFLFFGPYGCGKTETAMNGCYKSLEYGATVFYVKNHRFFSSILELAPNYGKAVVFIEDIEQELNTSEGRSGKINDILNTMDGITTKHSDIKVIVTTNHPELIAKPATRPGRTDGVYHFSEPDPDTAVSIICEYAGIPLNKPMLPNSPPKTNTTIEWDRVKEKITPQSASIWARVGQKIKNYMEQGKELNTELIIKAINSMEGQIALMNTPIPKDEDVETLMSGLGRLIGTYYKGGYL